MKLSDNILEEYQQRLELINYKRNLLEESNKELKELEKGSLEGDDFKRWDVLKDEILDTERSLDSKKDILIEKLPNLKQAYKDALFMEDAISKLEDESKKSCKCRGNSFRAHYSRVQDKHYLVCQNCGHSSL